MKKTTTIENTSAASLRTLNAIERNVYTRHIIRCSTCGNEDEFNEGDAMDAAVWFQMCGWKVSNGRAKCPNYSRGRCRY